MPLHLILLGAAVALLLVALLTRFFRDTDQKRANETQAFLKGFQYILSDDADAAISELTRAARLNSRTLGTYFALGALFRRKGEMDRAVRLHQNMLLAPGLVPEAKRQAQLELALDFKRAGLHKRAVECLEAYLASDPSDREGLLALRQVHEEAKEWEAAADVQERLARAGDAAPAVLAHLKAARVRELLQGPGADPGAALRVARQAAAAYPASADAHLALGEALAAAGALREAYVELEQAVELDAELAPVAVALLEKSGADVFAAEQLVAFLRRSAGASAGSGPTRLALARALRWRGEAQAAVSELRSVLRNDPQYIAARQELGAILLEANMTEALRAEYQSLLSALDQPAARYCCAECGLESLERPFRCSRCAKWDSFVHVSAKTGVNLTRADAGAKLAAS